MYWTDTADGHHCNRHNVAFRRGETCHECVTDPGEGEQAYHAEYDRKQAARIDEYRARARKLVRVADELLEGTDRDVAAACKAIAEATKLERLAEERQEVLDSREHDLTLCAHEERMSTLRGSH